MKIYGYWRSGTTHRVRLALGYKGINIEMTPVDLSAGDQHSAEFKAENPSGAVPTLVLDDGTLISQSTAIIEYLEDRFTEPPLLPASAKARARVRHLCQIIACDIHPLQNLRVQRYLRDVHDQPKVEIDAWLLRWIGDGLAAFEAELSRDTDRGAFCVGGSFSMAECFLIPQLYSARRFGVLLDPYPNILAVEQSASAHEFVGLAAPEAQPDARQ